MAVVKGAIYAAFCADITFDGTTMEWSHNKVADDGGKRRRAATKRQSMVAREEHMVHSKVPSIRVLF